MRNIARVLKRDLFRLLKAPIALLVVSALLILPSAYTWYNVVGFWNPYEHTGNLRVCVVDEDAGGSSELTGALDVGGMIVEQLEQNDQLAWAFTDRTSAMNELNAGSCYAVFVIPEDFTERLLAISKGVSSASEQPHIEYYVNEKTGPVSPKITDTGATTLDETVNSAFVSAVSDAVVSAAEQAVGSVEAAGAQARSQAVDGAERGAQALADARASLSEVSRLAQDAHAPVASSREALGHADDQISAATDLLDDVSAGALQAQQKLSEFSAAAAPLASSSLQEVAQASDEANQALQPVLDELGAVNGDAAAALSRAQAALDEGAALASMLQSASDALPEGDAAKEGLASAAASLSEHNAVLQEKLDGLTSLNDQAGAANQAASDALAPLDDAVQQATSGLSSYTAGLFGSTVPAVSQDLADIASTAASLSGALASQQSLADQAALLLDELDGTLNAAVDTIGQADALLAGLEDDFKTVRTDLSALEGSSALSKLFGEGGLDAQQVASFIGSPTKVATEQLYPVESYGAAMAPLFMNLTFWIGAFMLLVVMKQEVDDEGVPGLTLAQRYIARLSFFAVLAVLQAVICCAGLLVIGVAPANAPALFFAAAVASLSYLGIIYALSVSLQHVGKGLCVVLVFAQIPGATGLYPVEMTSSFFQAVSPLFPFTYGIGAMREAICGLYGLHYARDIAMLCLFFVGACAAGLALRPLLANANRMTARQVREGGIYNGEAVELPARPFRLGQILSALSEKDRYRARLEARTERFARWYPRLMRGAIVTGIAVPVGLGLLFALTPAEKVTLLTAALVWFALIATFLVAVESARYGLERQAAFEGAPDEQLIGLYAHRNDLVRAGEHGSHATPAPDGAQDEAGAREAACEPTTEGAASGDPTTEGAAHDGRKNPEGGDDRA